MSGRPIDPGFAWRFAFDFPEGFFEEGDGLRAQIRERIGGELLAEVSTDGGLTIEANRVHLQLTAEQTRDLDEGDVVTGFVLTRAGEPEPLGVIVRIRVKPGPTRPVDA